MKQIITTFALIAIVSIQSFSKSISTISGTVKDNNGVGLYTAIICVIKYADSSLVAADYTDTAGNFEISIPVDKNKYLIMYYMMGSFPITTSLLYITS